MVGKVYNARSSNILEQHKNDAFETPNEAILWLKKFIIGYSNWSLMPIFYDNSCGKNKKIGNFFKDIFLVQENTDILFGVDFRDIKIHKKHGIQIANPPFNLKDAYIEYCLKSFKFVALLLPITSLCGIKRNKLYVKYGFPSILPFDKRVQFMDKKIVILILLGFFGDLIAEKFENS